ncbi:MAG: tryptophan synthase subunit alpha [Gammaproteobacteria bacterium]|nr:tryptophan synthase subunit alpha [Gammaproteobacteria bacterium]
MNRLAVRFDKLAKESRKGLVTYLVAGDPDAAATVELMHAMVAGGADVIELGMPFTDPIADGPTIQAACERALAAGTGIKDMFGIVRTFREKDSDTPIVLMGYLNPLESIGYETFADQAVAAGADAVLVVDLPVEEAEEISAVLADRALQSVFLVSPTTRDDRLARISEAATGFVYYVSLKGVTGAGGSDPEAMASQVGKIREAASVPVGIGFGISDAESAVKAAGAADAVIIGSAIVRHIAEQGAAATGEIRQFVSGVRRALDEMNVPTG